MNDNPYASPAMPADVIEEATLAPPVLKIASQGKRFLNLIIDNVLLQVVSLALGFVVGLVYVFTLMPPGGGLTKEQETVLNLVSTLIGLAVALAYFIFCEAVFQRTPAKLLTGTLVVTPEGRRPAFGQIVGRSLARFIPFEPFSFLGGNPPVGWHDRLSGTRVIDLR